jgi:hypothetical protein
MIYETTAAYPQVKRIFWWSLCEYYHSASSTNTQLEAHIGLLQASFPLKPAYLAYARLLGYLGQTMTLNTTTDAKSVARSVLHVEFISHPGNYVHFASTDQVPGTDVKVYTVKP